MNAGGADQEEEHSMSKLMKILAVIAAGAALATSASAQSVKHHAGALPYVEIANEPAPKLYVDPPMVEGLPQGIVSIQY